MRRAHLAAVVMIVLLTLPTGAHATYDPLGSGQAKLNLDRAFVSFLARNQIRLSASAGARRQKATLTLPVTGGQVDPTTGKGEVKTEGTLVFREKTRKIPLRRIRVKSTRQPLIAKVGGSQLKLAAARRTTSKRAGFGTRLTSVKLALSAKLTTRLNKKLRPTVPFRAGQSLGTLTTNAQPALVTILGQGTATVALDATFLQKLDSRFVSLNPIAPAQRFGAQATFPIVVGGAIAPDGSAGTLRTGGDLEFLQLGAGQVLWHELWLDLGARSDSAELDVEPAPTFPGKMGRLGVLDLGVASLVAEPKARTITAAGAPLILSARGADAFNAAFSQGREDAFAVGETVGTISFTAVAH